MCVRGGVCSRHREAPPREGFRPSSRPQEASKGLPTHSAWDACWVVVMYVGVHTSCVEYAGTRRLSSSCNVTCSIAHCFTHTQNTPTLQMRLCCMRINMHETCINACEDDHVHKRHKQLMHVLEKWRAREEVHTVRVLADSVRKGVGRLWQQQPSAAQVAREGGKSAARQPAHHEADSDMGAV